MFALCGFLIASNWWHSSIIYSVSFFLLIVGILCFAFFLWGFLLAELRKHKLHPLLMVLAPAVIWVGIERILSSEIVGIPCNVGIAFATRPELIQSASIAGIYTTSFVIILSNAIIATAMVWSKEKLLLCKPQLAVVLGLSALICADIYMGYRVVNAPADIQNPLKVSIIQPVIGTDMYLNSWRSPETRQYVKDVIGELTVQASETEPDLLVWPEGGNGYFNLRIDSLRDFLYGLARSSNTDLLISSNDLDENGNKYNSIFSISREGKLLDRYNKVMLIPGPEDSYTPGEEFTTISSSYGDIGPSICYESNFPSPLRKSTAKGAELLYVSTSDAAFKKTALTINHTRTAAFRAVENNRWVIHASNTGPSAIVSPLGIMTSVGEMYQRGLVNGHVEMISEMSIYTRYGYLIPMLFSCLLIVLLIYTVWNSVRSGGFHQWKVSLSTYSEDDIPEVARRTVQKCCGVVLPLSVVLVTTSLVIISSSISVVFKQVSPEQPVENAFIEFLSPLDTFVKDTVGERFLQAKSNTCGPAVLAYLSTYFGKEILEDDVIKMVNLTEDGTSMLDLKKAAIELGFESFGVKANYAALQKQPLPAIAYINDSHYVVVNEITDSFVFVFDPAIGHVKLPRATFTQAWRGYLLLVRMKPIRESI